MQHAGLQYGQGAVNSHQSPPFAHADISQSNGGNTTSSLRQFRKKDGTEKTSSTDLNTSVENSHIARVPPHNHYPARPNDYYRYQHQFPDYNSPYKETPAQVKYSEIAETPPQSIQHVDHMPAALQKHKEVHKDFMDMCNISQQTHMKQNYPDNLTRQQSYPPDAASVHHQYLHKEPQVHPGYKPESQYQQYPQIPKYNMPSQCRKYPPPPPPPENDFLAKLQRINPSMARSIMSDHHIRESQATYPAMDQNRMYSQNQRYYPPSHIQNNISYNYQPYNYPSSCNYKHPEYPRNSQMPVGGAQYPSLNPHTDRSISPRNLHMMNYGTSPQKISPNYSQYNPPEYAQHYQHRRASLPQEYYQQSCRANPYMGGHQISPQPDDNRSASGGLRHFIENWAEEEGSAEVASNIFKDIRISQHNDSNNEQVFVINSSDIPQCLENVSLVPTENGQFIIKSGALDNSVVRIKETTETNGERTVNVQIVEATSKPDCMLAEDSQKTAEETPAVPYEDNQNQNLQNEKDCDEKTKTNPPVKEQEPIEKDPPQSEETQEKDGISTETSVIVSNEVSVIKDMPLIDEDNAKKEEKRKIAEEKEDTGSTPELSDETCDDKEKEKELEENETEEHLPNKRVLEESCLVSTTKRTQRIFSVDDIMNTIGSSPTETRRNSLQFVPKGTNDEISLDEKENDEDTTENMQYRNAVSIDDDSVILEIGGAWVQLNINNLNGTKVLSVLPLSESLVIDVNGNYEASQENLATAAQTEDSEAITECSQSSKLAEEKNSVEDKVDQELSTHEECTQEIEELKDLEPMALASKPQASLDNPPSDEHLEDIGSSVYQSEVVIGEESLDNEVFLELSVEETMKHLSIEEKEKELIIEVEEKEEVEQIEEKVALAVDDEMEHKEVEHREVEHREVKHREVEHKEVEHKEVEHKEVEHKEVEHKEVEHKEVEETKKFEVNESIVEDKEDEENVQKSKVKIFLLDDKEEDEVKHSKGKVSLEKNPEEDEVKHSKGKVSLEKNPEEDEVKHSKGEVSLEKNPEEDEVKHSKGKVSLEKNPEEDEVKHSKGKVLLQENPEEDEVKHSKGKVSLEKHPEDIKKPKTLETSKRRDEKRRSRDGDDRKKSSSRRIRSDERRESEELYRLKKVLKGDDVDMKVLKRSKIEECQKIDTDAKRDFSEDTKKRESSMFRKSEKMSTSQVNVPEEDFKKRDKFNFTKSKKQEKKLASHSSVQEGDLKKTELQEEVPKFKKVEKKPICHSEEEVRKKYASEGDAKVKKQEKKVIVAIKTTENEEDQPTKETIKLIKRERKWTPSLSTLERKEDFKQVEMREDNARSVTKEKELTFLARSPEVVDLRRREIVEERKKYIREKKTISTTVNTMKEENHKQKIIVQEENIKFLKRSKKLPSFLNIDEKEETERRTEYVDTTVQEKKVASQSCIDEKEEKIQTETLQVAPVAEQSNYQQKEKDISHKDSDKIESTKLEELSVKNSTIHTADVVKIAEEMITLKLLEETKDVDKHPTKAAKKLYINDLSLRIDKESKLTSRDSLKQKRSISKLEETVNKIKSLKEKSIKEDVKLKKTSLRDTVDKSVPRVAKKVTFNLETEVREISKEEMDKKRLSLEEYNSRKRKASVLSEPEQTKNKIMEDTVTSSDDINDEAVEQVELSVPNVVSDSPLKKSPLRMAPSSWEDDTPSPESHIKEEVMSTTNRKCIIDVNEFSIKPIESVSTPSPVSSSQFSYHSEDDSLQVYKDVVDSKLNSLNIKIPKVSKPKPVDRFSILLDRFLNKGSLNYEELEEVKKFIEIKRKMLEEEKKLTYEVKAERDYKDLKLHFRKVPEKRKKKRFRNLYAEDSSDSDSSRSEKGVGDYSVYQRDSQGVPKLIFKRKSGLPQPFVKLERSQAVELLAKKRKLY